MGDNWAKVQSAPIKSISVGPNTVWCLDNDNHLQVGTTVLYCTVLYSISCFVQAAVHRPAD